MAKYAKGKKSYAISDRGGQRVRYTQLKTTWDGLRVAADEWEPKHPQLTPAKNIIDAEQLFKPRSTGQDREDVTIYIAFTSDPFVPTHLKKAIGCPGHGSQGTIGIDDLERYPEVSGVGSTGAVGSIANVELAEVVASAVGGTGAVGTELGFLEVTGNAGSAGAGAVGIESTEISLNEAGVAGTGAVGTEDVNVMGWGNMGWGNDTWGDGR
jgi:hypothetical protein